jgi:uncharacterized YccA/Bax inhibitor family protein
MKFLLWMAFYLLALFVQGIGNLYFREMENFGIIVSIFILIAFLSDSFDEIQTAVKKR